LKSEESSLIILLIQPFQVSFADFTFYTCSLTCDGLALRFRRREFGCWKSASFWPLARLNFSRVRGILNLLEAFETPEKVFEGRSALILLDLWSNEVV